MFLLCKIILFFIYYFQAWADLCTHIINVTHLTNTYKRELWQNKNSNSHQQPLVLWNLSIGMVTFVKGENEMWKMPAKKRIQTRIVSASAVKRVLDLRFAPPLTWRCTGKKETPINYYAAIILITEMWQNISGENLRLFNSKILSIFGST